MTVVEWLSEPEVAVIVTVVIDVGVCVVVVLQAVKQHSTVSIAVPAINRRRTRRLLPAKQTRPKQAGSRARNPVLPTPRGISIAFLLLPVVAIDKVLVAAVVGLGVTLAGLNVQVVSAGSPLQLKLTALAKLPCELTESV